MTEASVYYSHEPVFRPTWYRPWEVGLPEWLTDRRWVPPGELGLYARARTGVSAALEQLGVDGGTALVPAYAPPSIVGVLADERRMDLDFYPVSADLSFSSEDVRERIFETEPAVVQLIHYFGFPAEGYRDVAAAAHEVGAVVLEDCARGLFARDREGALLGSVGDVAMFCPRKLLPAPNGGLVVARGGVDLPWPEDEARERGALLRALATSAQRSLDVPPDARARATELIGTLRSVRSVRIGRRGGGSTAAASADHRVPALRPGRLSRLGLLRVRPGDVAAARRERYRLLRRSLAGLDGVTVLTPPPYEGASPYGVAIRLPDAAAADRVRSAVLARGLPAETLGWRPGLSLPRSEGPEVGALRNTMVVFATHQHLPLSAVEQVGEVVREKLSH